MIAPELLRSPYALGLSERQKEIVAHKQGPLRVIAGPGSGKTRSITLLAMNLLLCKDAEPSEIVLCTYTEKAARELQDRLGAIAESVNYRGDLTQMRVGTIHGICQRLISEYPHRVELGNNYETLDQFSQQLLVFEHMDEICKYSGDFFQQLWDGSTWEIAKNLRYFFDKIVDELIYDKLVEATRRIGATKSTAKGDDFIYHVTLAYKTYQAILTRINCIDFAHLQKCAHNLLIDSFTGKRITSTIKYVLVDEYQDINYIQEQIVTLLASGRNPVNLCGIGDEDQSLYRFRGASVSNILHFPERFSGCKQTQLMGNYRCHKTIIATCNRWMETFDWTNAQGVALRTEKATTPIDNKMYYEYQSVATLTGNDVDDEAEQVAELLYSLKKERRITDYSQVALLLRSVRSHYSEAFIKAFETHNIPYHCARRRTFFEEYEVRLIVGCMTRILHFHAEKHSASPELSDFLRYVSDCRNLLSVECQKHPLLERELQAIEKALYGTSEQGNQRKQSLATYFYHLLFLDPFDSYRKEDTRRHNLMLFSRMLKTFQQHFRYTAITRDNLIVVRDDFFQRFFCYLYLDENSLDENQYESAPKDHVQIMTIHQAKGLEFPVVVVGRLDKRPQLSDNKDAALRKFYHSRYLESQHQIEGVDLRRLYYVAFSRAKDMLILTANRTPNISFVPLWGTLPAWSQARKDVAAHTFLVDDLPTAKPRYGFTSHIQTYMTCPRRYEFFYEHRFVSSRPTEAFVGLLVHHTIERIHRKVLDGELASLNEAHIHSIFEKVHRYLLCTNMQPVGDNEKRMAFEQVLRYFYHSFDTLGTIQATELNVSVERKKYVLTGKIDVLMKKGNVWEIRDLKTLSRPEDDAQHLSRYKQQLYLYAHALEKRIKKAPLRLSLYWTKEERQEDALMHIPYRPEDIQEAIGSVDDVVEKIHRKEFDVNKVALPGVETCRVCDVRHLCRKQGIVR